MRQPAGQAGRVRARRPGGGAGETSRRFFDPRKYRIVLFDQRGCGRSKPHASLVDNTTQHLVADMEALRKHLGIERWLVFGGSWGSTLSLAYAQAHPKRVTELVLRGIFMLRDWEIHWFYQHGASAIFPDHWANYLAAIPKAERGDLVGAFYKRLTSRSRAVQLKAAKAWAEWEAATSYLLVNQENIDAWNADEFAIAVARIECHYFVNHGFFEQRRPAAARRAPDPAHPGRDRAGPLRRGLPDAQRLGPAQGLARSRFPRGAPTPATRRSRPATRTSWCRRRTASREVAAGGRASPTATPAAAITSMARSRAIASRMMASSRSFASNCVSSKLRLRTISSGCVSSTSWPPRSTEYSTE